MICNAICCFSANVARLHRRWLPRELARRSERMSYTLPTRLQFFLANLWTLAHHDNLTEPLFTERLWLRLTYYSGMPIRITNLPLIWLINQGGLSISISLEAGLSLLNIAIRLTSPACQPGLPILYIRWCRINNANQACQTYYSKLLILLVYQTC